MQNQCAVALPILACAAAMQYRWVEHIHPISITLSMLFLGLLIAGYCVTVLAGAFEMIEDREVSGWLFTAMLLVLISSLAIWRIPGLLAPADVLLIIIVGATLVGLITAMATIIFRPSHRTHTLL
jgi:hypothetical protein